MSSEVPTGTGSKAARLRRGIWCLREVEVFRGGQPESHPGKRQSEEAVTEDIRVHMSLAVTL